MRFFFFVILIVHYFAQYLASRFDNRMRVLGSVMFVVGTMAWLPIVIYVPALAFNQGK